MGDKTEITASPLKREMGEARPTKHKQFRFALVLGIAGLWAFGVSYHRAQTPGEESIKYGCLFPLPNYVLKERPLQPGEGSLEDSSKKLHAYFLERTTHPDIDSLSAAVVTPTGPVFEQSYGRLKANETVSKRPVSRDSIYRIASITKLFTTLETLILRERGVLDLDDPVEKYLPEVDYPSYGWAEYLKGGDLDPNSRKHRPRITLRQLASHMSGIGRDLPPLDIEWPQNSPIPELNRIRAQGDSPLPEHGYKELMESINKYPLINLPYDYPVYSNSGIDLLGLANVAANNRSVVDSEAEPQTHEDLVKRDILEPLGLNSSFYRVPYETSLVDNLAIPNENHEWADFTFDDSGAPAGGQYSSLGDLETVLQSFLDPATNNGVISEHVVREWLHPLFTWKSGFQETGGPWEITIVDGGVRLYMKGGNIPGYHSEFVLVPELQYGIIVLVTGTYTNTAKFVHEAVALFQPAIQALLEQRVNDAYSGRWVGVYEEGQEGPTTAEVKILNGGLYVTELLVRGYDILKIVEDAGAIFQKPYPIALWGTGRPGEFRFVAFS